MHLIEEPLVEQQLDMNQIFDVLPRSDMERRIYISNLSNIENTRVSRGTTVYRI